MRKVLVNINFLHGKGRYVKGEERLVEDELAELFEQNGWVNGIEAKVDKNVTLKIDSSTLGMRSTHG